MAEYGSADSQTPNTLATPLLWLPHGSTPPEPWLRDHPGWIRILAVMRPRNATPGAPPSPGPSPAQDIVAPGAGPTYDRGGAAVAARRGADAAFADPAPAARLTPATDWTAAPADGQGWTYADFARMMLGIGSARAQVAEEDDETARRAGSLGYSAAVRVASRLCGSMANYPGRSVDFGREGADIVEFTRRGLLALLRHGAKPVRGRDDAPRRLAAGRAIPT
jgi:hypothetical protein